MSQLIAAIDATLFPPVLTASDPMHWLLIALGCIVAALAMAAALIQPEE